MLMPEYKLYMFPVMPMVPDQLSLHLALNVWNDLYLFRFSSVFPLVFPGEVLFKVVDSAYNGGLSFLYCPWIGWDL